MPQREDIEALSLYQVVSDIACHATLAFVAETKLQVRNDFSRVPKPKIENGDPKTEKRSPWEGPRGSGSPNEDPLGHSALQVEAVQTLAKPFGVLYRHLDKVGPLKVQKIHFSSLSLN